MSAEAKNSRKEPHHKTWLASTLEELKSQLTWTDLAFGAAAAILIAGLLLGFRFQELPEYKIGDIASQDVRAPQEVIYEDKQETANRREVARDRTPALYELEVYRIADLESRISLAFAAARQVLSAQRIPPKGRLSRTRKKLILGLLEKEVGQTISPRFLPLLLEHRFDASLETRILKVLGPVLRSGIVADPERFRQDVRKWIVLRDRSTMVERPLVDSTRVRSMEGAKEYLRQSHLEFAELSAPERAELFAFLDSLLMPTLVYNAAETATRREAAAARVPPVEIQIKKGKVVIRTGEEVTPRVASNLAAMRNLRRPTPILGRSLGFFFFVASFLYALWRYLAYYQRRYRKIRSHTVLVVMVIILVVIVMRLLTTLADILSEHFPMAGLQDSFGLYFAIPFSFAALLVILLGDISVGLIVSMVVGALAGLFYGDIYIAVYAVLGSLAGIYSISQHRERSGLAKSGLAIGVVSALAGLGIHLLRQDIFLWPGLLTTIAMGLVSGMFAAALSSISLPALESLFKITTDIRLLELSNLNSPMLGRLSAKAPGTYHHSLMVGALAEAAAEAIEANSLLVRVGAYYHDLGKLLNPDYFTENQAAGVNKHESLAPSVSRLILATHIKEGLELAKQAGLMETIRDMIPQHHGTRVMTYFYQKSKESAVANGREIREEDFRYPGPKPQSKEAAILMMADSVEAASRTLSNPSTAEIQGMIDRLIEEVLADNQLDECDITIREIRLVKESFLKTLTGIHHRRIDYPGYEFRLPEGKAESIPRQGSDIQGSGNGTKL
jgi:putative nucleotidyltransferase with HDIG domain